MPTYDYEHIEDFNEAQCHDVDNIVLLCGQHHPQKTRKRMDCDTIRHFQKNPFNKGRSATAPEQYLHVGNTFATTVGTTSGFIRTDIQKNHESSETPIFLINDFPVLSVGFQEQNGTLFVEPSLRMFDQTGGITCLIDKGHLQFGTQHWDITFVANAITVRQALGNIFAEIYFFPGGIEIRRATFFVGKRWLKIHQGGIEDAQGLIPPGGQYIGTSDGMTSVYI